MSANGAHSSSLCDEYDVVTVKEAYESFFWLCVLCVCVCACVCVCVCVMCVCV